MSIIVLQRQQFFRKKCVIPRFSLASGVCDECLNPHVKQALSNFGLWFHACEVPEIVLKAVATNVCCFFLFFRVVNTWGTEIAIIVWFTKRSSVPWDVKLSGDMKSKSIVRVQISKLGPMHGVQDYGLNYQMQD